MLLTELTVDGLRCLSNLALKPSPGINQIIGANGAGKTSVLEAIHIGATGHSFRSRKIRVLLGHEKEEFTIRLGLSDPVSGLSHQVGLQKTAAGDTRLRLDYQPLNSIVSVSQLLPVKVISPDSHQLVQEGPDQRRQFMDWGQFHVNLEFLDIWKNYRRALRQRNQILKLYSNSPEVPAWDEKLSESGEALDAMRESYVARLTTTLTHILQQVGLSKPVNMSYRRGWAAESRLLDELTAEQAQSVKPAFTTVGPHRADLMLKVNRALARDVLSRGEQKLLVYALHMAQLALSIEITGRHPVVLIDDLAAELDEAHQSLVLETLQSLGCQVFITGNEAIKSIAGINNQTFYLQGSKATEVV